MQYLIIDPYVLILPPSNEINREHLRRFLTFLVEWDNAAKEYNLEFGISNECIEALREAVPSLFREESLRRLTSDHLSNLNYEDLLTASLPFLQRLLDNSMLDNTMEQLETINGIWDIEHVQAVPPQYRSRLHPAVQKAFDRMLGRIAFARNNRIMPLSELQDMRLLTILSEREIEEWAQDMPVIVNIHYDILLEETEDTPETVEDNATLMDELNIVTRSDKLGLEKIVKKSTYKTVLDAVEAAIRDYPNRLILTDKAVATAKSSGYEKPEKIYDAICGLVIHWLTAYEQGDTGRSPDDVYKREIGYDISGEKEKVKSDPYLRGEREVVYKGETIFAEKHVKLSTGPNAARIYFYVIEEDGINQLLLVRAGEHPPTSRRRT